MWFLPFIFLFFNFILNQGGCHSFVYFYCYSVIFTSFSLVILLMNQDVKLIWKYVKRNCPCAKYKPKNLADFLSKVTCCHWFLQLSLFSFVSLLCVSMVLFLFFVLVTLLIDSGYTSDMKMGKEREWSTGQSRRVLSVAFWGIHWVLELPALKFHCTTKHVDFVLSELNWWFL